MIDETFGEPVASALNKISSVKARTTFDYGYRPGEEDAQLVSGTVEHNCLLLTHDGNTINEHRYPPCNHGGIIIFRGDWDQQKIHNRVRAFCLSGAKSRAPHAVTHLYENHAVIHTHNEQIKVRFKQRRTKIRR
jgi:hypothetical protein